MHLKKEFLLDFLEQAKEYSNEKKEDTIQIYNWCLDNFVWDLVSTLPKRDTQTVFLDKNALQELEMDINLFFEEEADYLKFGIHVVAAGVPILIPDVMNGDLSSNGMAFRLSVIPISLSKIPASLPVNSSSTLFVSTNTM